MTLPASLRAALGALDDGALEAAASKGLLRRAHRDHEVGLASLTHEDPERALLAVDGETVALSAGGLAAATCSCPAQGVCRHILAAVIVLRGPAGGDEAPAAEPDGQATDGATGGAAGEATDGAATELLALTPAQIVKAFGRAALRDAEVILTAASETAEPVAIEDRGRACVIKLAGQPSVRYLTGLGLAGMISKEPAPLPPTDGASGKGKRKPPSIKALHAAAVLGLRRQHAGEALATRTSGPAMPDVRPANSPAARPDDTAFLDAVTVALAEAARSGLATAPRLVEERLLDLALSSRADALPRLAGQLRGIAEDLSQRRDRAASFEPAAALAAMAQAFALVEALRTAGDDPILRGRVRQQTDELSPLNLVGCGLEIWRTPTGARGATAHMLSIDPPMNGQDTARFFTVTLARAAGQDPSFVPRQAVRAEPVWGSSLQVLARGGIHLDGARATADGRLSPGGDTRGTPGGQDLARLLDMRADLFVTDWSEIEVRVAALRSAALRRSTRSMPLLLRPAAVGPVQFDAVEQRAWLPVGDRSGRWLELTIGGDARLDAVAAMQAKGLPRVLVVLAVRAGAEIVLSPIAAMEADELASFDLFEPPPARAQKRTAMERLKDGIGALVSRPRAAVFAPMPRPDAAAAALVALAEDEALGLAELGGRMEDAIRLDRLARIAGDLDAAALAPLAGLLSRLATAPSRDRPLRLLAFKHAAACHAALAPRLPLVRRLS